MSFSYKFCAPFLSVHHAPFSFLLETSRSPDAELLQMQVEDFFLIH